MYYEHDVIIRMHITTLTDEVKPANVEETFEAGHWDYEVENTTLVTPAEVVAKYREDLRRNGFLKFKHAHGASGDLIFEILDDLKSCMEDFQTTYEEAL